MPHGTCPMMTLAGHLLTITGRQSRTEGGKKPQCELLMRKTQPINFVYLCIHSSVLFITVVGVNAQNRMCTLVDYCARSETRVL